MADSTSRVSQSGAEERVQSIQPPLWLHLLIGALLLILLAVTAIAAYLPLGRLSTPIAVSIAAAKAALILLYFMNLRSGDRRLWLVAGAGFVWLAILFTLSLSDFLTRGVISTQGK